MGRTLSTALKNKINSDSEATVALLEVQINGQTLRYAKHDIDLTSNSYVYTAFPFTWTGHSQAKDGSIGSLKINISSNAQVLDGTYKKISEYIVGAGVQDMVVTLKLIELSTIDEQITIFEGEVDSFTGDEAKATMSFDCRSINDGKYFTFPSRRCGKYCPWKFKDGVNCTYAGVDTTCQKTYTDCTSKSNTDEFGGLPWLK